MQKKGRLKISFSGIPYTLALPKQTAPMLARLDGRPLGAIAAEGRMDWFAFAAAFGPAWRALTSAGALLCSEKLP